MSDPNLIRKRIRSGTAMEIARIDRQKFNEYVADGFFNCAPQTRPGASRLFEFADLVSLYVFARLIEFGLRPERAGQLACGMKADKLLTEDYAVYIRGARNGSDDLWPSSNFNPRIRENPPMRVSPETIGEYPAIGRIDFHIEFHLAGIRAHIARMIQEAEETAIIGHDEAE
jgi:hypothetical protein